MRRPDTNSTHDQAAQTAGENDRHDSLLDEWAMFDIDAPDRGSDPHSVETDSIEALAEETYQCPWCGESGETVIDAFNEEAEWVEDCHVCCSPIVFRLVGNDDQRQLLAEAEGR